MESSEPTKNDSGAPGTAAGGAETRAPDTGGGAPADGPPPLHQRLIDTVFSPGKMATAVAAHPRWAAALFLAVALVSVQLALIPADIFVEQQRQAALEAGANMPEMNDTAITVMRVVIPVFGGLSVLIFSFLFAGIYTLIFVFFLGDEGRYSQYLAVGAHAAFIPSIIGLLLTPLRISAEDPQLSLSLSNFLFFLDEGYLLGVAQVLDLSQIWSTLVVAMGAHAIDRRRSFGSASAILLGILLAFALGVGFLFV